MITFCRLRAAAVVGRRLAAGWRGEGATVVEMPSPDEEALAVVVGAGLLPVALGGGSPGAAGWLASPAEAQALAAAGLPGWRITVEDGSRQVRDALRASGAAYLRTGRSRVAAAAAAARGTAAVVSVFANDVEQAVAAVAAGAGDLLLRDWDTERLGQLREAVGEPLVERTAFPPGLLFDAVKEGLPPAVLAAYLRLTDASGAARPRYDWAPGRDLPPPTTRGRLSAQWADAAWREGAAAGGARPCVMGILHRSLEGRPPSRDELETLLSARGGEVEAIAAAADRLRARAVGDRVTYVVNRNINFTNRCIYRCGFCAFSVGESGSPAGEEPFLLSVDQVAARAAEAWEAGATEVCLQGGIHPGLDGRFYLDMIRAVRQAAPAIHIHALSPLEVRRGAQTLGMEAGDYLRALQAAGLGSLPGTAAEVFDAGVRRVICPAKISAADWATVVAAAHRAGIPTTATMMFGHIDSPSVWAVHLDALRRMQRLTGGFTEFVPLPFVHMEAPIYRQGRARPGPTWDEVVLVHAVARLAFDGAIPNIQASWVKLGLDGAGALLRAGANDLGGTLMEESISRAAGGRHGGIVPVEVLRAAVTAAGRTPAQRTTLYEAVAPVPETGR